MQDEVRTSALTGEGIDDLAHGDPDPIMRAGSGSEEASLNNMRQHETVLATLTALDTAAQANAAHLPHELLLVDLHAALGCARLR